MDFQITAKSADEVLKTDGNNEESNNLLEKTDVDVPEISTEQIKPSENVISVADNSADNHVEEEKTVPHIEMEQAEKDPDIHTEEIRPASNISGLAQEAKKEEIVKDAIPKKERHSIFNRRPAEVSVLEKDFNKQVENKLQSSFDSTAESLLKVQENDIIQTDLIRTNVYYMRKLYDEMSELKRALKLQSYIKMGTTIVFLLITIYSVYQGMHILTNLTEGGLNGLMANFSGMGGLDSFSTESMSGNLFGSVFDMIGGGGQIAGSGADLGSDVVSNGGFSMDGLDISNVDLNSVQSIVDKFLK